MQNLACKSNLPFDQGRAEGHPDPSLQEIEDDAKDGQHCGIIGSSSTLTLNNLPDPDLGLVKRRLVSTSIQLYDLLELTSKGFPRSLEESNCLPLSKVPT
jgi:hypothetical protein